MRLLWIITVLDIPPCTVEDDTLSNHINNEDLDECKNFEKPAKRHHHTPKPYARTNFLTPKRGSFLQKSIVPSTIAYERYTAEPLRVGMAAQLC